MGVVVSAALFSPRPNPRALWIVVDAKHCLLLAGQVAAVDLIVVHSRRHN